MSAKPETNFRKKVRRDLLALSRRYPIFYEPVSQKSICGTADFVVCISGRFIWLELKAEDGTTSRIQEVKIRGVAKAGGMGVVGRPSNWKDLLILLTDLAKEKNSDQAIVS